MEAAEKFKIKETDMIQTIQSKVASQKKACADNASKITQKYWKSLEVGPRMVKTFDGELGISNYAIEEKKAEDSVLLDAATEKRYFRVMKIFVTIFLIMFLGKNKLKKKKRKKKLEENSVELSGIKTTMPKNKSPKKNSGQSIIFKPWGQRGQIFKSAFSTMGTLTDTFLNPDPIMKSQFKLNSIEDREVQLIFIEDRIIKLKHYFNEQFRIVYRVHNNNRIYLIQAYL